MTIVKKEGILLEPSKQEFESKGVLNPACIREGNYVHMFYRAIDKDNISSIGYCKLEGPLKIVERAKEPVLKPEFEYEKAGVEDPRIVKIGSTYYMTYVAYDGQNVRIAYATSKDLKNFHKKGVISPEISYDEAEDLFRGCKHKLKERYFLFESFFKDTRGKDVLLWNKDAFLFPKKINEKYVLVHRVLPDIQIIRFKKFEELTLDYWKSYFKEFSKHVLLESKHWYESRNIGGGVPPIETDHGWVLIYHAVDDLDSGKIYRAGVALLDKKNPQKVLCHPSQPLFEPDQKWEKIGVVGNVVFPTGAAIFGNKLYIYYGAADKYIGVVSLNFDELLHELASGKVQFIPYQAW
ncbi:MAG: pesticidal protein Cry7Aa [archaeon]